MVEHYVTPEGDHGLLHVYSIQKLIFQSSECVTGSLLCPFTFPSMVVKAVLSFSFTLKLPSSN